jgi:dynein heavy chain
MNTVLDDNKKLCLTNGETVKLSEGMRIVFEVEDLLEASPATVSRCGMVFLEGRDLGWEALFEPWFAQLAYHLRTRLHHRYLLLLINSVFKGLVVSDTSSDGESTLFENAHAQWLFSSFLRLFECFLYRGKTKKQMLEHLEREREKEVARLEAARLEGKAVATTSSSAANKNRRGSQTTRQLPDREREEIASFFALSLIWACGATLQEDVHRKTFEGQLRTAL